MERDEILKVIRELVDDYDNELNETTLISDSVFFDSLSLTNIFVYMKSRGFKGTIVDFISCKTVSDLIALIHKSCK